MDVLELVGGLASQAGGRTEADIQSDIKMLLTSGALDLDEAQLRLESPTSDGSHRRIDIEVGFTIIEVKKKLKTVTDDEQAQLAGYLTRIFHRAG